MPVLKCPNGKYRIGGGPCVYESRADAERAYTAYRAKTHERDQEFESKWNEKKRGGENAH